MLPSFNTRTIIQKKPCMSQRKFVHILCCKCCCVGDGYYNLQKQHSTGSGNGGVIVNSEGYSYVNDVPSLQSSHHRHSSSSGQQKSSSSSHRERDHQQQNRTRRTQRRVTHNEKRYHSGQNIGHCVPLLVWSAKFSFHRLSSVFFSFVAPFVFVLVIISFDFHLSPTRILNAKDFFDLRFCIDSMFLWRFSFIFTNGIGCRS